MPLTDAGHLQSHERGWPLKQSRQHTPGPWHVAPPTAENPSRAAVHALSGLVSIYEAPLTLETAANADLIAAAPEMLGLLAEITDAGLVCPMPIGAPGSRARYIWDEQRALMERARAVVRKAQGGAL